MNEQQETKLWEPDEVDLGLLERVRTAPPDGVSVWDLKDEFEIDEGGIFDRMATWIRRGEPLSISALFAATEQMGTFPCRRRFADSLQTVPTKKS